MKIIARSITLMGNLPDAGEREGGTNFSVQFEIRPGDDVAGDFTLTFHVLARNGVAEALDLAREKLISFAKELKAEATDGDFGHRPTILF